MTFDFKARVRNLRKSLKRERMRAFVTVVSEGNNKNPYYLSGFGGTTGALAVSQKGIVLAVDSRYTLRAKKEVKGVTVVEIPKGKKGEDLSVYVETALSGLRVGKDARIGFEGAHVPILRLKAWEKHIPGNFIATRGIVEKLRQIKDAEEILHLSRAGEITSKVFEKVSKTIRAGQRECDIAAELDIALRKYGAVGNSFQTIVASGANAAIPHHETSTRKIKAGETVVLDFGGIFPGGYCSDITRTIFVKGKKPKTELIHIYRTVREANKKALQALKPGMTWKEYDAVARVHIEKNGYGKFFTHGLGHSLGLEAHDPYDYAHDAFQTGNVLSNEPGIYLPGIGGVRIEDDVVVTKTGARNITPAPYLSL
jgi:Xaa-Pro aminopeptidase